MVKYLSRYTHRIAISNSRLLSLDLGVVRFTDKDYADKNKQKVMNLPAVEFIRRFLLHILPDGFVRIRMYGFLNNRVKGAMLPSIKAAALKSADEATRQRHESPLKPTKQSLCCPLCKKGVLQIVGEVAAIIKKHRAKAVND